MIASRFFVRAKPIKEEPKPLPPPEPTPQISFSKGKLSVVLNNVELQQFPVSLRLKTGRNYLITNGTNGRLTG